MTETVRGHTERGFSIVTFQDRNGVECTLQKSSLAYEDAIWLGAAEIGLRHFKAGQGWRQVELVETVEENFVANNRMHLNQEQVRALLPFLQRFADTGEI